MYVHLYKEIMYVYYISQKTVDFLAMLYLTLSSVSSHTRCLCWDQKCEAIANISYI